MRENEISVSHKGISVVIDTETEEIKRWQFDGPEGEWIVGTEMRQIYPWCHEKYECELVYQDGHLYSIPTDSAIKKYLIDQMKKEEERKKDPHYQRILVASYLSLKDATSRSRFIHNLTNRFKISKATFYYWVRKHRMWAWVNMPQDAES